MVKKNKNLAKIAVFFCITALTAFAGIAQAHEHDGDCGCEHSGENHHHDFKKMHHHGFMKMEKKLGLTDAQKAQAKTMFQKNRDVVKPIITNLRAEQNNLRALMFSDTVDEAAIRAETLKIAGIRADLNVNRAKVGAQFRAILTPTQRDKLKTFHNKKCQVKDSATAAPAQ